jgi:Rrf2 family protein
MLEQLLLRLRRAGLIEARRGRQGGYRLTRAAALIPIAAVLEAARLPETPQPTGVEDSPADLVTRALEQQLQRSINRTLEQMSLEELLFDWRSAKASQDDDGGLQIG